MKRPNLTPQEVQKYFNSKSENITAAINKLVAKGRLTPAEAAGYLAKATKPFSHSVYVIAIRGYYKDTMGKPNENDRGIYDDAIVLVGPNYLKTFNGNTDPRVYKKDIATLLPGIHYFKQGYHGFNRPTPAYKAFRTANIREVTPVLRDGENGIKDGIYINIHAGGDISTNSAGCQTIKKDQYKEFQQDAYKMMDDEGQKELPYILLEA